MPPITHFLGVAYHIAFGSIVYIKIALFKCSKYISNLYVLLKTVFHSMFSLPPSSDSIFLFPYYLTRINDKGQWARSNKEE